MSTPTDSSVAAILLAAGRSQRFGGDKLLADLGGTSVLTLTARALAASRIRPLIAVTGPDDTGRRAALAGLDVVHVLNTAPLAGQGRSIAQGIAAVGEDAAGALIVPGDMPLLDAAFIDGLVAAFIESGCGRIVHPALAGEQRAPVIWPRSLFGALAALDGDRGGKHILAEHARSVLAIPVPLSDAHRLEDIDTPDDLARLSSF